MELSVAAEEAASVDAASSQLPPKPSLLEQTLPLPEAVMVRSGGRFSLSAVASRISSAFEKIRRALEWDFCEEELDEEPTVEDPRVSRILVTRDRILDLQKKALRENEPDRMELLQKAYYLLKIFLRKIENTAT